MAQLHPTCKKLSQVEKQDTAKEQFLLNCSLANVYVWAAAIIYRDEAVGSFGIYGPESTRRKLLSCAMYSLQIPKWGFVLHHP